MKVLCLRYPRNAVTDILICLLCVFIISLILIRADYTNEINCITSDSVIAEFLSVNGWQVDFDSEAISEKTIPYVFDDTYEEYSYLQKKQGFDITSYKGKRVAVVSYQLQNFPGYENSENVLINLLMYNNKIIGADILCTSINGFITGAVRNGNIEN